MGKTVQRAGLGRRKIKLRRVNLEALNEQHMQGDRPVWSSGLGAFCLKGCARGSHHLQSITAAGDWMRLAKA